MLCDVCGGPFEEGEQMLDIPAIGWRHGECLSAMGVAFRMMMEEDDGR